MKVLIVTDANHAVGSLDSSLLNAFASNSFEVSSLYPPQPKLLSYFSKYSFSSRIILRALNFISFFSIGLYVRIKLKRLVNYELIFVLKGLNLSRMALMELKKRGNNIVCFNPDDPLNMVSSGKRIIDCIPLYDHYFIWSKRLVRQISDDFGVPTTYLPFAADPELHALSPGSNKSENASKISFIGNWDEEREKWLASIERLDSLKLYGINWERKLRSPKLKRCIANRSLLGGEFSSAVNASQINLNILRLQNKNSCNMRTFEIAISGGFQLHEYSEEAADFFEEGKEIEFFRTVEELNEKISFYLENPDAAAVIAEGGFKKVVSKNHVYQDRVARIWRAVNDSKS